MTINAARIQAHCTGAKQQNCPTVVYNSICFSTEAQIRFLKAKIRVMQEELDRLAQENNKQVCLYKLHIIIQ